MDRKDILRTSGYWITKIQLALYNCAYRFMENSDKNRTQLAEHLGVSKGYVTQLLSGDYDHKLSKIVELSLALGYIPKMEFIPVDAYEEDNSKKWHRNEYTMAVSKTVDSMNTDKEFFVLYPCPKPNAA